MRKIHIIDKLILLHGTLNAKRATARPQTVHLRQGDMDGACAVYSLMMAMITCDIINRKEVEGLHYRIDGRSSLSKLLKRLTLDNQKEGLVREGLFLDRVDDAITHTFTRKMRSEYSNEINNIEGIASYLDNHTPVIVGATYRKNDGGHALLAIGYEAENNEITKLFCLDPATPYAECNYWNAVIHINCNNAKEYRHSYMPLNKDIKIDETIAIFKK